MTESEFKTSIRDLCSRGKQEKDKKVNLQNNGLNSMSNSILSNSLSSN